ncbi:MAG: DUF2239 family protein [Deferribacterales bacterium]
MSKKPEDRFTAFFGGLKIASGTREELTEALGRNGIGQVLVFNDRTGEQTDLGEIPAAHRVRRGRPKLGVVSREVSLLPKQWRWLSKQEGGASETIRGLVDAAMKEAGRQTDSQEACYRTMMAICGNRIGYEEAVRALFAGDREKFAENIKEWPKDIAAFLLKLAENAFNK